MFYCPSLPSLPQGQVFMSRRVYSLLLSFCGHSDEEIKIKSMIGFGEGYMCTSYNTCNITCVQIHTVYLVYFDS